MNRFVPAVIADLTADWLDGALRESGVLDVRVTGLVVEPLGAAAGLLGDLARVRPTYGDGHDQGSTPEKPAPEKPAPETTAPETMVVKLPATAPGARHVGTMLRAWAREVAFYTQVAPLSPEINVPRCFHTGSDDAAERWVVVLEDIDGDEVDHTDGATQSQAEAAVDALAAFHGAWWENEKRFDWMPGFDSTGVGGLQGPWLDAHPHFLHRYGHLCPGPTAEWLNTFAPRLTDWSTKAAGEPLTIVHADYRLDNLLFTGAGAGDTRVTMIDWQTALRGPAAMDLSCFIATSLSIENRRRWEADLIDRYLGGLGEAGIQVDSGWFNNSYDETLLWWMGQFGNNLAHLEPEEPQRQEALNQMVTRTFTTALDRNVGRLLSRSGT